MRVQPYSGNTAKDNRDGLVIEVHVQSTRTRRMHDLPRDGLRRGIRALRGVCCYNVLRVIVTNTEKYSQLARGKHPTSARCTPGSEHKNAHSVTDPDASGRRHATVP
jgi:hypothetical protein